MKNVNLPFSIHEAVLLLDAYLDVHYGVVRNGEAVKKVSNDLRQMAINRGIAINESYRSFNGIYAQMRSMKNAYCHTDDKILPPQIFIDTVALYNNDKARYSRILTEARNMTLHNYSDVSNLIYFESDGKTIKNEKSGSENAAAPDVFSVNFKEIDDLSFTKPIELSYFDEQIKFGKSWTDLYVAIFSALYDDYGRLFTAGMAFSRSVSARPDLGNSRYVRNMSAPKYVRNSGLFLETNLSAKNIVQKIKYLLDLCLVDYENVVIKCKRQRHGELPVRARRVKKTDEEILVKKDREDDKLYESVLKERFPKGFRINSNIDLSKFKRAFLEINGKEPDKDDKNITAAIRRCGIVIDNKKVYHTENVMDAEIKDKLFLYIKDTFDSGKNSIYYEALYKEFKDDFLDSRIKDGKTLKIYLEYVNDGRFFIQRSCISKNAGEKADPASEVREYLKAQGEPTSVDKICSDLPHIPKRRIETILSGSSEFVRSEKRTYFHADNLMLADTELEQIAAYIESSISEHGFISGTELSKAIKTKFPWVYEENGIYSELGLRDALKHKLSGRFSFKSNIISGLYANISTGDVYAEYAKSRDSFTIDDLTHFAEEIGIGLNSYLDNVYQNSLRISKSKFVSKDSEYFKIAETDNAISRFCPGDYIAITDVFEFGGFPEAKSPWNSFLLEQFVYKHSEKFCLLHSGFSRYHIAGAIVKKRSEFTEFDDLVIDILANSGIELNRENALDHLLDHGYLARRSYSGLEEVLLKAKAKRVGKETK